MTTGCRLALFLAVASARLWAADPAEAQVRKTWKMFREAVAGADARTVAGMTYFPFRHPVLDAAGEHVADRKQFLARFGSIFTAGIRKQVARGTPVAVTEEKIREARESGEAACGQVGDWVVELPPEQKLDLNRDDEAYLRLAFRVIEGKAVFHRILSCE